MISGTFRDTGNTPYTLNIDSPGTDITIGENGFHFGAAPAVISFSRDSYKDVIVKKSMKVNIITPVYIGTRLFNNNGDYITVELSRDNGTVFAGFIEPNVFNQDYNSALDEFEINCIDRLSILQYYNFGFVNTKEQWQDAKNSSEMLEMYQVVTDILNFAGCRGFRGDLTALRNKYISPDVIYGDDFDDVMTLEEALECILKYWNLHVVMDGWTAYIYDNTMRLRQQNIEGTDYRSADTNISVNAAYSSVKVTCETTEQDTLVTSPLDKDSIHNASAGTRIPYMDEYISEGSGDSAVGAIRAMIQGNTTNYDAAKVYKWFFMPLKSDNWKIYWEGEDIFENGEIMYDDEGYIRFPAEISMGQRQKPFRAFMYSFGSAKGLPDTKDNSPVSSMDMKNYLIISVNGNETDKTLTINNRSYTPAPTDEEVETQQVIMEYVSPSNTVSLSPISSDVTNYIVFQGKILLQPIVIESTNVRANRGNYWNTVVKHGIAKTEGVKAQRPNYDWFVPNPFYPLYPESNLARSQNNDEGRYYTRHFYTCDDYKSTVSTAGSEMMQPVTEDKSAAGYKYSYTYVASEPKSQNQGQAIDKYYKIPILKCSLRIGDMMLRETMLTDTGDSAFEWINVSSMSEDEINDVYFSLGFNPKIGDKIVGQEFDIQNTISYQMGLDASGTAIPIKQNDKVAGKMEFKILGICNPTWDDVIRIPGNFWKHSRYNENEHRLLSHVESVIITDFQCKFMSDGSTDGNESDITYTSDTADVKFSNPDEDTKFEIMSQPTPAEFRKMGVPNATYKNIVYDRDMLPWRDSVKLNEARYAEEYFTLTGQPQIDYSCTIRQENIITPIDAFIVERMGSIPFMPMSAEWDVRMKECTYTMRQNRLL